MIKTPANELQYDQSSNTKISDPGDSNKVLIYGGGLMDTTPTAPTTYSSADNKLDFTYAFYGIGFHHEDMGDTFVAVSYMGHYNVCANNRCSNSYV